MVVRMAMVMIITVIIIITVMTLMALMLLRTLIKGITSSMVPQRGHHHQGSLEFEGMSNWFCNQAVCPGGVCAECTLGRMMGMTKLCLNQSESWNARLSTNRRARFAAGRFPCVRCLWPVDPAVHCTVRYSRVNCPTPYHRFIIILVVVILLSCFYQTSIPIHYHWS